jgi:hypothetical protein
MAERSSGVDLKHLGAWSSIAYASGFLTVMLHTARLGFPVLELFSTLYFLVGAPFGVIGFLSTPILRYFRSRASNLASQAKASWTDLTKEVNPSDIDALSTLFGLLEAISPYFRFFRKRLEKKVRQHVDVNRHIDARTRSFLHRSAALGKGLRAVVRSVNLLSTAIVLIFALCLYVWKIYPLIPQQYGGGAPVEIQVLLDQDKLPPTLSDLPGVPVQAPGKASKTAVIGPVKLLYSSKHHYFLEGSQGERFSLSRGAVEGILWTTNP